MDERNWVKSIVRANIYTFIMLTIMVRRSTTLLDSVMDRGVKGIEIPIMVDAALLSVIHLHQQRRSVPEFISRAVYKTIRCTKTVTSLAACALGRLKSILIMHR
jgi:hypothetical protein